MFNKLDSIDKIRLAIYTLENKNFKINFNINDMIIILKEILNELAKNYHKQLLVLQIINIYYFSQPSI